jgi:hypothetical protein
MAMVVIRPAMPEPDWLQFDIGDAGRDIQPGLALHADRLQRVGMLRTADQKIAAETDANGSVGADPAIIARKLAASDPAGRRIHRPGKLRLLGKAEVDPEPARPAGSA